ncbi:hypothetical protein ACFLRF_01845 [Candidatus Altiarchaeota archaeon]
MRIKSNKAQAAVEYLMTYGWAILVILVVGVVIWQMGILEIGKQYTPGKRGFSQIKPLDWKLQSNGDLTIVLTNEGGTILNLSRIDGIIVAGGSGECTNNVLIATGERMRPASIYKADITGCTINEAIGEYYRVNVTIRYNNPASGLPHVSNGIIWGPLE